MKSYVISAWLVLLSTTACLQNVNCAYTQLMSAVNKNDVDLVKRLLANGADLRQRTERLEQAGGPAGLTSVLAGN